MGDVSFPAFYAAVMIFYRPWTSGWGPEFSDRPTMPWGVEQAAFNYTIENGTVTITGYTGPGGEVVIPETIEGLPVTGIGRFAFHGRTTLTGVTIPASITSIGGSAFRDCTSLTGIIIPESVAAIGDNAFAGCTSLTGFTIPDSVIQLGIGTFASCSGLTNVTIGKGLASFNESSEFVGCTSLSTIAVSTRGTWHIPVWTGSCSMRIRPSSFNIRRPKPGAMRSPAVSRASSMVRSKTAVV